MTGEALELGLDVHDKIEEVMAFIERIVLSGGGAKGVVNGGAYRALWETGVIQKVRQLAGSSAGAITATLWALGMDQDDFRTALLSTNLKQLMGENVYFSRRNDPGVILITRDGDELLTFIEENINTILTKKMARVIQDFEERRLQCSSEPDVIKLDKILDKLNNNPKSITFGDLGILHRFFPEHFKDLSVTAVDFENKGKLQIFNSTNTPDVEVALACRASASIPGVLAPVKINVNGEERWFVDGGLFDNLPTDYFDPTPGDSKPSQTLVLAFGEGLDNDKNQIFQALYGARWDEVVSNILTDEVLVAAINNYRLEVKRSPPTTLKVNAHIFIEGVIKALETANKNAIDQFLKNNPDLTPEDESKFRNRIQQSYENKLVIIKDKLQPVIEDLFINRNNHPKFWNEYNGLKDNDHAASLNLLRNHVAAQLKPVLYDAGFVEKLKRNSFLRKFVGLKTDYKNTDQKELGYQKLRSEYPLRTVELRVGSIKTTDFNKATKVARVMDSLGYLDTMSYVLNYDVQDNAVFSDAKKMAFYPNLVNNFIHIYTAVLKGANKTTDSFMKEYENYKKTFETTDSAGNSLSSESISRELFYFIKKQVESDLHGSAAFALSRAVEFRNKTLLADDLYKETYEESFKRSGLFAVSNVSNHKVFTASALHKALESQSLFALKKNNPNSRSNKVFNELQKIENFIKQKDVSTPSFS